ncbi:MAG: neutral/alkaline non-lysosomal ceramidase N-terminal domain-containing protein [Myxococcales bacterium]|nr:neutral/alkaline non-lysosomal ceramidase N-terminal domain-containing protein [Myxococcales bacterium]MCB9641536.1 neutral/alkaline non-lysosomal ceramidase N-terminal domain-containing protein [Myxococcales bacterium]
MRRISIFCFLTSLFLISSLWNCTPPTTNSEQTTSDASPDENKPQCVAARDCSGSEDCVEGKCVKTTSCKTFADCQETHTCYKSRCVTRCDVDTDCPAQHVCTYGQCHKPVWKTADPPNKDSTTPKAIQAGLGLAHLDVPLGISMAGYGLRVGPTSPYAESLGATTGQYDRFYIKALALDDGVKRVILVRSPMCWVSDFLHQHITQYIIDKIGVDLSNSLIITATHTHSGPGRFWNLLPGKSLGFLGYGEFLPEGFRRIVASFGDAIIAANKDLKPARFGYAVDPNFDQAGEIFSDRRGASPSEKHPILTVMRIDREDGTPLAVLFSFPMHGIIHEFNNFSLTQDAAGGAEMGVQDFFEQRTQKRIEAFFMQGPAGDVSPRGDKKRHKDIRRMQMIGALTAPSIWKMYDQIQPKTDIRLDIVNKRIGISRKLIGYKDDEFYEDKDGKKMPYRFGGLKCVDQAFDYNKEPDKKHEDGHLGCVLNIEMINDGTPVPQFAKTRLTAAKIGDLVVATFPGEATSFLARRLRRDLDTLSGGKLKDLLVLGYSQDHHFYLLEEQDWWRGGYEASMNIWGPRFGEYLEKNLSELANQLWMDKKPDNATGILPQDFFELDLSPTVAREKTPTAGQIVQQPPKTYMRLENPLTFVLSGGFLGVDNPYVVLQKQDGGSFKDVERIAGRIYDDSTHRIIMSFTKKDSAWHYTFSFEELQDFPTGTYRFRVEGKQWDGEKIVPYTAETDAFEIKETDKIQLWNPQVKDKKLEIFVGYPAGTNDDGTTAFEKLIAVGHRLRSSLTHWAAPKPIDQPDKASAQIVITQGGTQVLSQSAQLKEAEERELTVVTSRDKEGKTTTENQTGLVSVLSFDITSLATGTYQVEISFTDAHGNKGTWKKDLDVP